MTIEEHENDVLLIPFISFYEVVVKDAIINATHISLYFALNYKWKLGNCISPFEIKRDEIMKLAKISSRKTFNNCMRVLHEAGYIKYIPSFNPDINSMVCLV